MKFYNTPSMEIMELNIADVITISAPDELANYDDTVNAPHTWF